MRFAIFFVAALVVVHHTEQKPSWTELLGLSETILMSRIRDLKTTAPRRESLVQIQLAESTNLTSLVEEFLETVESVLSANDPFSYSSLTIDYTGYGVILEFTGEDLIASGFSSFTYSDLQIEQTDEDLVFGINFNITGLQVTGSYDINSNIFSMFPVYGNGTFGFKQEVLGIELLANLEQTNSTDILQITSLELGVTVEETKVDLKNIYYRTGLSKLITNITNDIVGDTFTTGSTGVPLLNNLIAAELNSLMTTHQITLETIIEFLEALVS